MVNYKENGIKELIKNSQYSQKEVARLLGMDESQFSRNLAGKGDFTLSQFMDLCSILKVDPSELYYNKKSSSLEDEENRGAVDLSQIIELLDKIYEGQQQMDAKITTIQTAVKKAVAQGKGVMGPGSEYESIAKKLIDAAEKVAKKVEK